MYIFCLCKKNKPLLRVTRWRTIHNKRLLTFDWSKSGKFYKVIGMEVALTLTGRGSFLFIDDLGFPEPRPIVNKQ